MGAFGNNSALNKLSSNKPKEVVVKKKITVVGATPNRTLTKPVTPSAQLSASSSGKVRRADVHVPRPAQASPPSRPVIREAKDRVQSIKRLNIRRPSPVTPPPPTFTSDDEGSESDQEQLRKKRRIDRGDADITRKIRDQKAFSAEDEGTFKIVHAADIANIGTDEEPNDKYTPFFTALAGDEDDEAPTVALQYPNASQCENYQIVKPTKGDLSPINEILNNMKAVADYYVDPLQATTITDPVTGMIHSLTRAINRAAQKKIGSQTEFLELLAKFNDLVASLRSNGTLARNLDEMDRIPLPLIQHILTQIYSRTVSPQIHLVRRYKAFADSVYGELKPGLLNRIFKETKLKSDQVFVDMGSGVGNCVLQAALQVGCESFGCEKESNPARLAALQATEFPARCRLWGIKPGKVRLVEDDFLENQEVNEILKRADVVLINNQAFNPPLMEALTRKFLDLKDGCQIVCLKPFRAVDHKIKNTNLNDVVNKLDVRELDRWSDEVDWADKHGKWYIHRKDDRYLQEYLKRLEERTSKGREKAMLG